MIMRTSYRKLWESLIDHNYDQEQITSEGWNNSVSSARFCKGKKVIMAELLRICESFKLQSWRYCRYFAQSTKNRYQSWNKLVL